MCFSGGGFGLTGQVNCHIQFRCQAQPDLLIEDGDFLSVAESFQMRVDDSLSGQESGTNLDRRSVIPPGFNRRNRDGFVLTDDIDVCLAVFAKSNRPGWQQIRRDLC